MADMGNLRAIGLAISIALAALTLAACGSGGAPNTAGPPLSRPTANRLATLSQRVASDLDAGDTCDAAHAADELKRAVEAANLPDSLRPGVDEVAGRLVDEVNCPPPPPPPPQPKEHNKQDEHHGDQKGPKPPGHGGHLPPGQAKLKGEVG